MEIFYIVIALQNTEVDSVIAALRADGKPKIADWLEEKQADLYGDGREDWKPFMDQIPISTLLETTPPYYQSSTSILDSLTGEDADVLTFKSEKVELFIIDIFALYLQKYIDLARIINLGVFEKKYCLIVPYGISKDFRELHNLFIGAYRQRFGNVYSLYVRGAPSRIVGGKDDFTNYIKLLHSESSKEDGPYPGNVGKIREKSGLPNVDGPLPTLAIS